MFVDAALLNNETKTSYGPSQFRKQRRLLVEELFLHLLYLLPEMLAEVGEKRLHLLVLRLHGGHCVVGDAVHQLREDCGPLKLPELHF